MKEEIMWYVEQIKSEWGMRKLLCFLRALLSEEQKRAQKKGPEKNQG